MSSHPNARGSDTGLSLSITSSAITPSSTPVSPGTAMPYALRGLPLALDRLKASDIEPPLRPKSTPFSWQENSNSDQQTWTMGGPDQCQKASMPRSGSRLAEESPSSKMTFSSLPTEIHELILDHLFGVRASTAYSASSSRGWSMVLRHSRRRQLSDVALVDRNYREFVQGRLFKHSEFTVK
jgi:hypothetical protein